MKKVFWTLVVLIILGGVGYAGYYYWENYYNQNGQITPPPITNTTDKTEPEPEDEPEEVPVGLPYLTVPENFTVTLFAENLDHPRVLTMGPDGYMLFSSPEGGKVYALKDEDLDGEADDVKTVLKELNKPHGLVYDCVFIPDETVPSTCYLYVAESDKVSRYLIDQDLEISDEKVLAELPDGGRHFTRTLMLSKDDEYGDLFISIGSSCDVCHEEDTKRASIMRLDLETLELYPYATGLRNSVFMTMSYVTGDIFATEMGRDELGDNLPPDEINSIKEGKNYGWPICYGNNVHDSKFDTNTYIMDPCKLKEPAHVELPAHSAPLGLAFVPEEGWPGDYWYDLFVSYHGSWNRSEKTGYKVVQIKLDENGEYEGTEDFITGWLDKDGKVLGRPVDIWIQPGGLMYITDDYAGKIYRVTYTPPEEENGETGVDSITLSSPKAREIVESPLIVEGEATGYWYFEASFPIEILDSDGNTIAQGHAEAKSDWMTEDFVPFEAEIPFSVTEETEATIVLQPDDPSGQGLKTERVEIPVFLKP